MSRIATIFKLSFTAFSIIPLVGSSQTFLDEYRRIEEYYRSLDQFSMVSQTYSLIDTQFKDTTTIFKTGSNWYVETSSVEFIGNDTLFLQIDHNEQQAVLTYQSVELNDQLNQFSFSSMLVDNFECRPFRQNSESSIFDCKSKSDGSVEIRISLDVIHKKIIKISELPPFEEGGFVFELLEFKTVCTDNGVSDIQRYLSFNLDEEPKLRGTVAAYNLIILNEE